MISMIGDPSRTMILTVDGEIFTLSKDDHRQEKVVNFLKENGLNLDDELTEELQEILNSRPEEITFEYATEGEVTVVDGKVMMGDVEVHHVIAEKILEFAEMGFPYDHMAKFLQNLKSNPSKKSVDQLYPFLEVTGLTITEDGCFLGYKGVQDDFSSSTKCKKTGKTVYNVPGTVVEMPRNEVEDDPKKGCAAGLHVGSLNYASSFAPRTIVVKVNPKDCVSVPEDHGFQKLRACRYEVVRDLNNDETLDGLYDADGNKIEAQHYTEAWESVQDDLNSDNDYYDDDYYTGAEYYDEV